MTDLGSLIRDGETATSFGNAGWVPAPVESAGIPSGFNDDNPGTLIPLGAASPIDGASLDSPSLSPGAQTALFTETKPPPSLVGAGRCRPGPHSFFSVSDSTSFDHTVECRSQ